LTLVRLAGWSSESAGKRRGRRAIRRVGLLATGTGDIPAAGELGKG
jgi:hypothetical protein